MGGGRRLAGSSSNFLVEGETEDKKTYGVEKGRSLDEKREPGLKPFSLSATSSRSHRG